MNQRRYALAIVALAGLFAGTNLGAVLDDVLSGPIDPSVISAFRSCPTCADAVLALAAAALSANLWLLCGAAAGLGLAVLAYGLLRRRAPGSALAGRSAAGVGLRWSLYLLVGLAGAGLLLRAVTRTAVVAQPAATATPAPTLTLVPLPAAAITLAASTTPTRESPATSTQAPVATEPSTAAQTPTAGPTPICADASDLLAGLLINVDRDTALDRDFAPDDLAEVRLDPANVSYQPISLRTVVHQPLLDMVSAMNEAGLSVVVVSGYRSYTEQVLAHEKWQTLYPDRAPEISALPGHSEHQLGTAVDFSTPYMSRLYGETFHVNFSKTAEGQWLIQNAPGYGFALSYPAWATEATGYAWEPWHFRYVGRLALELTARSLTLTQYLKQCPGGE